MRSAADDPDAVARVAVQAQRRARATGSPLGRWFWEIDRLLLLLVFVLICIGLVAVAAASPAAASRYSDGTVQIGALYYFKRQLIWVCIALPVMIAVSMLPIVAARRIALIGAAICFLLLLAVPFIGSRAPMARPAGSGSARC